MRPVAVWSFLQQLNLLLFGVFFNSQGKAQVRILQVVGENSKQQRDWLTPNNNERELRTTTT
jgi:hypothetical protein